MNGILVGRKAVMFFCHPGGTSTSRVLIDICAHKVGDGRNRHGAAQELRRSRTEAYLALVQPPLMC